MRDEVENFNERGPRANTAGLPEEIEDYNLYYSCQYSSSVTELNIQTVCDRVLTKAQGEEIGKQ